VPFYVALPSSSFDWNIRDGLKEIPIEERGSDEVNYADGWHSGELVEVRVTPQSSAAANFGFDVTPRQLVTGLITERGICEANEESILRLFPEHRAGSTKSRSPREKRTTVERDPIEPRKDPLWISS
jgi:methylthioribose-1-phosphate isomerase